MDTANTDSNTYASYAYAHSNAHLYACAANGDFNPHAYANVNTHLAHSNKNAHANIYSYPYSDTHDNPISDGL